MFFIFFMLKGYIINKLFIYFYDVIFVCYFVEKLFCLLFIFVKKILVDIFNFLNIILKEKCMINILYVVLFFVKWCIKFVIIKKYFNICYNLYFI